MGSGPELPVFDPVNDWIYISNGGGSDNVTILNGTTLQASVALGNASPLPTIIDTQNGDAYVAANHTSHTGGPTVYNGAGMTILNGSSILRNISLGAENTAIGGAYDSWNGCVYETLLNETNGTNFIAVINGTSWVASIATPAALQPPVFDPVNGLLYVPNLYQGTVSVVDGTLANGTRANGSSPILANVSVGEDLYGGGSTVDPITATVNLSDGYVYVVNQQLSFNGGSISVLNGTSLVTTLWLEEDFDGYCPTSDLWDPVNGYVYVFTSTGCSGYYRPAVNVIAGVTLIGSYFASFSEGRLFGTVDPTTGYLYVSDGTEGQVRPTLTVLRNLSLVSNVTLNGVPGSGTFDQVDSLLYIPTGASNMSLLNASYVYPAQPFPSISSFVANPDVLVAGSPLRSTTTLTVHAAGGIGWLNYSYPELPLGCTSANTTNLTCTPSTPGPPPFYGVPVEVEVTDSAGNTAGFGFNLTVLPGLSTNASVAQATVDVGEADYFHVASSGGLGPVNFSWEFGDGVAANVANVSHSYASPGTYSARVWANDSAGESSSSAVSVVVAPALGIVLSVSNSTLALGQSLEINATAAGGRGPYQYSYTGLPPGCVSVDASGIGCLPTQVGGYNLTVDLTDQNGGRANATVLLHVVFGFTVAAPSSDVVGQPFSIYVQVAQSAGDVQFTYSALPSGCPSQDSAVLTCTPEAVGNYSITVAVLSSLYGTAHRVVDLSVVGTGGTVAPGSPAPPSTGDSNQLLLDEAVIGSAIGAIVIAAIAILFRLQKRRS